LKEVVDALITGGLIVSDAPAHLHLQVVQTLGPERGVTIEVWPGDGSADPRAHRSPPEWTTATWPPTGCWRRG
jgi:hypothetical protein